MWYSTSLCIHFHHISDQPHPPTHAWHLINHIFSNNCNLVVPSKVIFKIISFLTERASKIFKIQTLRYQVYRKYMSMILWVKTFVSFTRKFFLIFPQTMLPKSNTNMEHDLVWDNALNMFYILWYSLILTAAKRLNNVPFPRLCSIC